MSLLRSASKVSLLTLVSRVFGYVRDGVFAATFGAQAELDIFLLAFKIPNFMRRIFAEGAFSQAFIPVLTQYEQGDPQAKERFLAEMCSLLLWSVTALTMLVWLFPGVVISIFAFGLTQNPEKYKLAKEVLSMTFPYLGFVTIAGFFVAALQTKRQFIHGALAPICLNIVLIISAMIAVRISDEPVYIVSMAVPIAGFLQMFLVWTGYIKAYPSLKLVMRVKDPGLWKVLSLMLAAVYGVSVSQIGLIVDNSILSTLAEGSVSWMYYAERLSYFPLGVFGVAMTTVLVPALASSMHSKNEVGYRAQISWGLKGALLIGLPAAISLSCLAQPITITLFYYGKFSWYDVIQTSQALAILALGVPAFMIVKVLNSAFYARQDTWTPVKYATCALCVNIAVAAGGVAWLQHKSIAFAIVTSAYTNMFLLFWGLYKKNLYTIRGDLAWDLVKIHIASIPLASVLICGPQTWQYMSIVYKLCSLVGLFSLSWGCYAICLWLGNMRISTLATQN